MVVNTHYKAELVTARLAARQHPKIEISHEAELLETGGGVPKALPLLDEMFFVLNSDVLWLDGKEYALTRLAGAFDATCMDAVLLLQRTTTAVGYKGSGDFFSIRRHAAAARRAGDRALIFTGVQCCIAGCSTASAKSGFRCSLCTGGRWRPAGSTRSCMTASGTISARPKASPRPARASTRTASSGSAQGAGLALCVFDCSLPLALRMR